MKKMKNKIKTYSELIKLPTFKERLEYLQIGGKVGAETFGFDRYLNQSFYKSEEWRRVRDKVIIRDNGCDLGISDREIYNQRILVHHMNPITKEDIINKTEYLLNPEYLITTIENTHNTIHYGIKILEDFPVTRYKNDTCPWKMKGDII